MKYEGRNTKYEVRSKKYEVRSKRPEVSRITNSRFLTCLPVGKVPNPLLLVLLLGSVLFSGCYSFKDVTIPPEVKTIRIQYIENRAPYINPQLAPQLNDRLRQKITNQTRLTIVQTDDADYDVSGKITNYSVSTSGISQQQTAINRLTVAVSIHFVNHKGEAEDYNLSRNFDFSANLSLQQAESQLNEDIIKNMVDEIFNRLFSNW